MSEQPVQLPLPGFDQAHAAWRRAYAERMGAETTIRNRSGIEDGELDYSLAESVVTQNGKRLLEATSDRSVVLSFDWDMDSMSILSVDFDSVYL